MIIIRNPKSSHTWRAEAQRLAQVRDDQGHFIDAGILDTCVVLNLLHFTTSQSCEGHHDDEGTRGPWVEIVSHQSTQFHEAATAILAKQQQIGSDVHPYDLYKEGSSLLDQANYVLSQEALRLLDHLQSFYLDRQVPLDWQLIVTAHTPGFRLACQGNMTLAAYSPEKQEVKLQIYQQQMQNFTNYLISCL